MKMKVCNICGYVHRSCDVTVVGRFSAVKKGYRSTVMPNAPTRPTRELAMKDTCEYRRLRKEGIT